MVKFIYENEWMRGENNVETAIMIDTINMSGLNIEKKRESGILMFRLYNINNLQNMISVLNNERLKEIKKHAIHEWKTLQALCVPFTPVETMAKILNKLDQDKIGFDFDEEFLDISMPYGTYTMIIENGRVMRMSTNIELFDGQERVDDCATIFINKDGELEIKS